MFTPKALYCRDCFRVYSAEWRKKNPEKSRAHSATWRKKNPDKEKAKWAKWRRNHPEYEKEKRIKRQHNNPEYNKEKGIRWRRDHPEYYSVYERERKINDPNFRMIKDIRSAVCKVLRGKLRSGHTIDLLGCSVDDLRKHIERQFQPGMTWENRGRYGWHIDHIIPLSYFDFSDPEQQKRAWHYTNLQPLWAADNLSKNNKILEMQLVLI